MVRLSVLGCAVMLWSAATSAQTPAPRTIRGVVRTAEGIPVVSANVFVLETLDGALSSEDGRFAVTTTQPGSLTLIVKRLGFESLQRVITVAELSDSLVIILKPGHVALAPITVQAGSYTAGEERGASLTPLEVVTTPGATA